MKIDSSSFKSPPLRSTSSAPQKPADAATQASEAVSLSATASAMQGNEKPPVNAARIQEIKDAITQGRFKVNPEAIADGLLETARDLVSSQRKA